MVIEVAGQVNAFTDAQLDRLTGELGPSTVAVLSGADHSRYGAVFLLADTERVGEAFVIGVARFGSAADFAGLPPLPIVRVEVIRCQRDVASPRTAGVQPLTSWLTDRARRRTSPPRPPGRPRLRPASTAMTGGC
jgi:hypothetical protein